VTFLVSLSSLSAHFRSTFQEETLDGEKYLVPRSGPDTSAGSWKKCMLSIMRPSDKITTFLRTHSYADILEFFNNVYVCSISNRDFKKYTSKKIIQTIQVEPESRREWLLEYFSKACEHLSRPQQYKVWQDGYHAEEIFSNHWIKEKIKYIHENPVKEKIVTEAENYYFSSARNYADLDSALDVEVVFMGWDNHKI
jgi:hypothetical protein